MEPHTPQARRARPRDEAPLPARDPMERQDPLAGALTRDRARLLRLRTASLKAPNEPAPRKAFDEALAASRAAVASRAASAPAPIFDDSLPIAREAEKIVELIRKHQVVVIAGETGSGKTTQLPKLCLAAGRGSAGMIGCTQPRRIAARSVARRVAQELGVPVGGAVGFQVRFNDQVSEQTRIKFMTDGILLAEMQSDRWLSAYDTLIIDEAHERSLNIDFLLGYLKTLVAKRPGSQGHRDFGDDRYVALRATLRRCAGAGCRRPQLSGGSALSRSRCRARRRRCRGPRIGSGAGSARSSQHGRRGHRGA